MIIRIEIVEILMMKMIKNLIKMIKMIQTIKNLIKMGSTQTSVGDFPSWPTTEVSFKSKIFLSHLKGLLKETFVLPTSHNMAMNIEYVSKINSQSSGKKPVFYNSPQGGVQ